MTCSPGHSLKRKAAPTAPKPWRSASIEKCAIGVALLACCLAVSSACLQFVAFGEKILPCDCVVDQMEMYWIYCCEPKPRPISCIIFRNGNALGRANARQLLQAFGLIRLSISKKPQKAFRAPRVYRRQINAGAPDDFDSARRGCWAVPIGRERQLGLMGLICQPKRG